MVELFFVFVHLRFDINHFSFCPDTEKKEGRLSSSHSCTIRLDIVESDCCAEKQLQ